MAEVEIFTRKVEAATQPQSLIKGTAPTSLLTAGRLLSARGAQIKAKENAKAERDAERVSRQWASEAAAVFRRQEIAAFATAQLEDDEPTDFSARFMLGFDNRVAAFLETAPDARSEAILKGQLANFGTGMLSQTIGHEAQQLTARRFTSMTTAIDTMANNASTSGNLFQYNIEMAAAQDMIADGADDLDPAKQQKLLAMAENKITRGYLKGLIGNDPEEAKVLLEGGVFDKELTALNKEALLSAVETEINKRARVRDAARKSEYNMLKGIVDDIDDVILAGYDAAGADQLEERIRKLGGKEADELLRRLGVAKAKGKVLTAFAMNTLVSQRNTLNLLRIDMGKGQITPEKLDLFNLITKSFKNATQAIATDALSHAVQVGVLDRYTTLDFSKPETIAQRGADYERVKAFFGDSAMPFTDPEIDAFIQLWDNSSTDEQLVLSTKLASEWRPELIRKFAQKIGPNNPTLAYIMGISQERPELARMVLQGQKIIDNMPEFAPVRTQYARLISNQLGDILVSSPQTQRMMTDAILAVYMQRQKGAFDPAQSPNETAFKEAIRLVMGGKIMDGEIVGGDLQINGKQIFSPLAGMTQNNLDEGLNALITFQLLGYGRVWDPTERTWVAGGPPVTPEGEPIPAQELVKEGKFRSMGDGMYTIFSGGGFVQTKDGFPYVIDLKGYFGAKSSFIPTSEFKGTAKLPSVERPTGAALEILGDPEFRLTANDLIEHDPTTRDINTAELNKSAALQDFMKLITMQKQHGSWSPQYRQMLDNVTGRYGDVHSFLLVMNTSPEELNAMVESLNE